MTERDRTRLRGEAARLFGAGVSRARTARILGVARSTVGRWYRIWQQAGGRGLLRRARPGRASRLDAAGRARVTAALAAGPRAHGFALERWSLAAAAALIERLTGERYHRRHVGRLLCSLGWVVPPVGRHADRAFRREVVLDPEGNPVSLLG